MPATSRVLAPRTAGLHLCRTKLHGTIGAIYDVTMAYPDVEDRFSSCVWTHLNLLGYAHPSVLHFNIRRMPIESVPKEEAEFAAWLQDIFYKKDALLKEFRKTGVFPGPQRVVPVRMNFSRFLKVCTLWIVLAGIFGSLFNIGSFCYSALLA